MRPGDALVLTKPIGTGLISTGLKSGAVSDEHAKGATEIMAELNATSMTCVAKHEVHACTDVSGFGLLGHLWEMTRASLVDAEIEFSRVPFLPGALELAQAGFAPGGSKSNLHYVEKAVSFHNRVTAAERLLLADAQTSGGLLVAVPEDGARTAIAKLRDKGVSHAQIIGRATNEGSGRLRVTP